MVLHFATQTDQVLSVAEDLSFDTQWISGLFPPGYLGKQAQFKKRYEVPIQRDNDVETTLEQTQGIECKGPLLSTLMKLKSDVI